ncbi:Asp-tRNA(Asn)/Glu-tRNA(Gln) amidotransferase subunit GatC [Candidatus Zinderia endosymbiont of Aphrophora alni]|uniref:Asp-tRNA(Asn)/Glu-tRNA(Gln) amidotransferase subunit GatC n=1 Tax=Candidatus Zinderia endosymbiont of Aphrophora alni TaxID=3077951 RepID=UPI0030D3DF6C
MKFNIKDIHKMAKIAYLKFTDKEIKKFLIKINDIFNIIKKIKKIKTNNIKPMNHPIKKSFFTYFKHLKKDILKKNIKYKKFQILSKNIKNNIYLASKILD